MFLLHLLLSSSSPLFPVIVLSQYVNKSRVLVRNLPTYEQCDRAQHISVKILFLVESYYPFHG